MTDLSSNRIQCHDFGLEKCCDSCRAEGATFDAEGRAMLFLVQRPLSGERDPEAEVCCRHTDVIHKGEAEWRKGAEMRDQRLKNTY